MPLQPAGPHHAPKMPSSPHDGYRRWRFVALARQSSMPTTLIAQQSKRSCGRGLRLCPIASLGEPEHGCGSRLGSEAAGFTVEDLLQAADPDRCSRARVVIGGGRRERQPRTPQSWPARACPPPIARAASLESGSDARLRPVGVAHGPSRRQLRSRITPGRARPPMAAIRATEAGSITGPGVDQDRSTDTPMVAGQCLPAAVFALICWAC
jgi:hypothetical protein